MKRNKNENLNFSDVELINPHRLSSKTGTKPEAGAAEKLGGCCEYRYGLIRRRAVNIKRSPGRCDGKLSEFSFSWGEVRGGMNRRLKLIGVPTPVDGITWGVGCVDYKLKEMLKERVEVTQRDSNGRKWREREILAEEVLDSKRSAGFNTNTESETGKVNTHHHLNHTQPI